MNAIQLAVFIIHHTAFEQFVKEAFRFDFDYHLASRMPAGSIIEYRATGLANAPDSIRDKAARLLSGKRVNDPATILNVLVDREIIPPGTYRIDTREASIATPKPDKPWKLGRLKITGMLV
ncbi:hypothetical protein Pan44_16200 [Caulifigura coniformis]|uniref:Uncharacterized protein n=1 Tax=Caulifigura coniformis TaxID=2527983 RepID=A0A517SBU4_9PLAN|nr:hypothetical protein Pan44_16200 [Caulifigura coniformis]